MWTVAGWSRGAHRAKGDEELGRICVAPSVGLRGRADHGGISTDAGITYLATLAPHKRNLAPDAHSYSNICPRAGTFHPSHGQCSWVPEAVAATSLASSERHKPAKAHHGDHTHPVVAQPRHDLVLERQAVYRLATGAVACTGESAQDVHSTARTRTTPSPAAGGTLATSHALVLPHGHETRRTVRVAGLGHETGHDPLHETGDGDGSAAWQYHSRRRCGAERGSQREARAHAKDRAGRAQMSLAAHAAYGWRGVWRGAARAGEIKALDGRRGGSHVDDDTVIVACLRQLQEIATCARGFLPRPPNNTSCARALRAPALMLAGSAPLPTRSST